MKFLMLLNSLLFFPLVNDEALSQRRSVDTDKIESLVDEWNFANNTRSVQSFEKVYSERLLFDNQTVSRAKAIALKLQQFKDNPDFRQRIVTIVNYTPYSSGVVRCDFSKEVRENGRWKRSPAYLLVRFERDRYAIIGESNYVTEKSEGTPVRIDTPNTTDVSPTTTVEETVLEPDSIHLDDSSLIMTTSAPRTDSSEFVGVAPRFKELPAILAPVLSNEMISIPKGYVFILIGMLSVGGLMIFIADSMQKRRQRSGSVLTGHDDAAHATHQFRAKSIFDNFVITLFDPILFKYRKISTGRVFEGLKGPDYEFEFNHKGTYAKFAVKCQYYKHTGTKEVQLFSPSQQHVMRNFEEDRQMQVYYVLGFGGKPDDPNELFLVPLNAIKSEFVSKTALRQYSKSGMFFFNISAGRLQ